MTRRFFLQIKHWHVQLLILVRSFRVVKFINGQYVIVCRKAILSGMPQQSLIGGTPFTPHIRKGDTTGFAFILDYSQNSRFLFSHLHLPGICLSLMLLELSGMTVVSLPDCRCIVIAMAHAKYCDSYIDVYFICCFSE